MLKFLRWAGLVVGLASATLLAREPANLGPHKLKIRSYVESGQYDREIAAVAAKATAWLEQRAKQGGGRLAVVFDLDETLLSNWPLISRQDFGYVPALWDEWVAAGNAPAITAVADLYRVARRLRLEVIFLTGRRELRDRAGTEKNLRVVGCGEYSALIFKPDASEETTGAFKLAERRRLTAEGRVIIANVGDQESDFQGGLAERNFKLPDPFYVTN